MHFYSLCYYDLYIKLSYIQFCILYFPFEFYIYLHTHAFLSAGADFTSQFDLENTLKTLIKKLYERHCYFKTKTSVLTSVFTSL